MRVGVGQKSRDQAESPPRWRLREVLLVERGGEQAERKEGGRLKGGGRAGERDWVGGMGGVLGRGRKSLSSSVK